MGRYIRLIPALLLSAVAAGVVLPSSAFAQGQGSGWTLFTDPTEKAFAVEVPQGWAVTGGVGRVSPIIATPWVAAKSPDGATQVFFGDPEVPGFRLPQPGQQVGAQENSVSPELPPTIVLNYRPGASFAELYGPNALAAASCTGATVTGRESLPELAAAQRTRGAEEVRGIVTQGTFTPPVHDAGLVTFTCQSNGRPISAGVIADTLHPDGAGSWAVSLVGGYLTVPGQESQALAVLNQILASRQWNPQWDDAMRDEVQQALKRQKDYSAQVEQMLQKQSQDFTNMLLQNSRDFATQMTNQHNAFMAQMAAQGKANTAKFEADEKQKDMFAWNVEGSALGGGLVRDPKTGNLYQLEPQVGLVIPRGK